MLTDSDAVCKQVNARLARQRDTPQGVFADPIGNIAKSRQCGCEICSLVCKIFDESSKERVETEAEEVHRDVKVDFSEAGMSVEGLEVFVTDCESKHLLATKR